MLRTARRSGPLALLLVGTGCIAMNEPEPGTGPIVTPPEARWVVRTAVGPGNSLIQDLAASPTTYVVGAAIDLIAYNTADGSVRWRRTDVPSRAPIIVDDTLVVTLVAGESAGLRLSDGQVRWRTRVAGAATSYQPVRVGRLGIVTGFDGEVSSVDLYTGATRLLGTGATLLGDATRVHGFAVTGDTLYVVGQVQPAQLGGTILGLLLIARVDPVSGAVLARHAVPVVRRDFLGHLRPSVHGGLLVVPTGGSVVVIDRTTWAVPWRDSSGNVGDPGIRDGRIYTGDGVGDVVVRELETGASCAGSGPTRRRSTHFTRAETASISRAVRSGVFPPTAIARALSTPANRLREWCGLRGRCTATRRTSRWRCVVRKVEWRFEKEHRESDHDVAVRTFGSGQFARDSVV